MVRIGEEPCIISLESPCRELSNDRRFIHVTNKTAKYNVGWYRETSPLSSKEDRGFYITHRDLAQSEISEWYRVRASAGRKAGGVFLFTHTIFRGELE